MKAVVWHGIGDIRLDEVEEPRIEQPTDAIVRVTASAICGTDLHLVRGTVTNMKPGTILGHEGVGVIEALGSAVRDLTIGDRVVIPSTIACGSCEYCRSGYYAQCDRANPHGKHAGTAFFGGPANTGPFQGLQAERARIPFAQVGLVKLPDEVTDQQAIVLSDIFPTAYFGASLARIEPGNTVAVFGCGPVGLLAIVSAKLMDAGRVLAVDRVPSRLAKARELGAEIINFDEEDPVEALMNLTDGEGVDRAIDAVGVDATRPHHGPAEKELERENAIPELDREVRTIAPHAHPHGDHWVPGDGPSLALMWATTALRKYGTLAVIGVYPQTVKLYPIGEAMGKNLTIRLGNCDHRRFIPPLLERVRSGAVDPERVLSHLEPLVSDRRVRALRRAGSGLGQGRAPARVVSLSVPPAASHAGPRSAAAAGQELPQIDRVRQIVGVGRRELAGERALEHRAPRGIEQPRRDAIARGAAAQPRDLLQPVGEVQRGGERGALAPDREQVVERDRRLERDREAEQARVARRIVEALRPDLAQPRAHRAALALRP